MELRHLLQQIRHLRTTKRAVYGTGLRGWISLLYYGLFRINRFVVMKADLQKELPPRIAIDGATFEYPAIGDLAALRSGRELPREFYCDQFQKVYHCCVGKLQGELAFILWIYRKGDSSRFLRIVTDTTAELNYQITLPEFRRYGLSKAGVLDALWVLKEQGFKTVFGVMHEENIAAIKSLRRAGFVETSEIYSVGPLNRKLPV